MGKVKLALIRWGRLHAEAARRDHARPLRESNRLWWNGIIPTAGLISFSYVGYRLDDWSTLLAYVVSFVVCNALARLWIRWAERPHIPER